MNQLAKSTVTRSKSRKSGLNKNKIGSVRNVNGRVYVDFHYMNHRIRENSGLPWTEKNARVVRKQLDKIIVSIDEGSFKFAKVFPNSKKVSYYTDLENKLVGKIICPNDLLFKDYTWDWYIVHKDSGRVTERTMHGYKSQIELYLLPYFGDYTFNEINASVIDGFIAWARKQKFRKKAVSNKTINKCLIPLRMICNHAAIKYNWGASYNPFFGFKKLKEERSENKIHPFTISEQHRIIKTVPNHWKAYFKFAFSSGLRQGEQIALKRKDIDWKSNTIHVRRAITLDENGKKVTGTTKNCYSQRSLEMLPMMRDALEQQEEISKKLNSKYLFCTPKGKRVDIDNLRRRVWIKTLEKLELPYRPMIQTRHTFATTAFSLGENPLWIAKVMGHRNTDMIIRVYAKYVENLSASKDGSALSSAFKDIT